MYWQLLKILIIAFNNRVIQINSNLICPPAVSEYPQHTVLWRHKKNMAETGIYLKR